MTNPNPLTPEELAAKLRGLEHFELKMEAGASSATWVGPMYMISAADRDAIVSTLEAGAWRPIAEAPKDGTHILAYSEHWTFAQSPPTVAHWFPDPDEPGFYTSVNEREPGHPFRATHWQPLPSPPKDTQ